MKTHLKKMLSLTALGVSLLTNTVPTWAGGWGRPEVTIVRTSTPNYARASLNGARYSTDSRQYIGCRVSAYPNGSRSANCAAQTSTNDTLYCATNDPKLIERLQKMSDSSIILFNVSRTTAACTDITVFNHSSQLK